MNKTIGELIDELSIINIKIYMLVDKVMADQHTREEAKTIQDLNLQRSKLKNAINGYFNEKQEIKI